MRRFDAAPRRATPKGHKSSISCTATHQESRLPTYDSSLRAWRTNAVQLVLIVDGRARRTAVSVVPEGLRRAAAVPDTGRAAGSYCMDASLMLF